MTSKAVMASCATRMESRRQISKCYVEICDVASGWPGTKPYWDPGAGPGQASAPRPPGSCPVVFSRASGLLAACQISYLCMESSPFLQHSGHRTAAQCHVTAMIPVGTPCPSTATSGFVALCVFFAVVELSLVEFRTQAVLAVFPTVGYVRSTSLCLQGFCRCVCVAFSSCASAAAGCKLKSWRSAKRK